MKVDFKVFILLFFLFNSVNVQAQKIENLVFEGAGIRGLAYGGVIQVLEEEGLLKDVKNIGGTSAGAITSLLLTIGYSSEEIITIISSTKFKKFNDGQFFFIGGLMRMKKRYGWYRGEKFSKWLYGLIEAKTNNGDITFDELVELGYPSLYCVSTSINKQELVVLSYKTYPKMRVKDAVRASMSIPLYFGAVFIDEDGKLYKKPNKNINYQILVDGGITGNYPINLYDSISSESSVRIINKNTIGFRIDSELQTKRDLNDPQLVEQNINNLSDFIGALYIYTIENLNRNILQKEDWERTVSLSSKGIGPKIKKLSNEQKQSLIQSGRDFTNRYLDEKGYLR